MNDLSWLIYLAEVSDKARVVVGFTLLVLLGTGVGGLILIVDAILAREIASTKVSMLVGGWALIAALFAAFYVITPSSRTIYMIAASEFGETVVTSPEAMEMMTDLKTIIKNRLKEELE